MSRDAESSPSVLEIFKPWLFPMVCAGLYALGFVYFPDRTTHAVRTCFQIFKGLAFPLCMTLGMMILLNRFLSPAVAARLLGKQAGIKGIAFSSLAGIVSMGPIYAWYPLFKALKGKGVSSFHIANFMSNRAIKPVLFPVLVGYFGWELSGLFLCVQFIGALTTAACVGLICRD